MVRRPTRANKALSHSPLEVIERAKSRGVEEVIVSYSGGKDAIVTLDLCFKHFKRVEAFFQYVIPDLSYEEEPLRWAERHYDIKIKRVPHWVLSRLFRESTFRHPTSKSRNIPLVKVRHIENAVRQHFGIRWIASGEKTCDSPHRNGYIRHCEGVEDSRLRLYPVAYWSDTAVMSYLSLKRLPTPVQYRILSGGKQFGGFGMESMAAVHEQFPEDFAKIRKVFPLIETQVVRHKLKQKTQPVPEVREDDLEQVGSEGG